MARKYSRYRKPSSEAKPTLHTADRVYVDGVEFRVIGEIRDGVWELASTEAKPRYFPVNREDLRNSDRFHVVPRVFGAKDGPFPKSVRRQLFIKAWWMSRVEDWLKKGGSKSDESLEKLIEGKLGDIEVAVRIWEKEAAYDHSKDRHDPTDRPRFLSPRSPALAPSPRHLRRMFAEYKREKDTVLALRNRTENMNRGGRQVSPYVRSVIEQEANRVASEGKPTISKVERYVRAIIVAHNKGRPEELHEQPPCWTTVNQAVCDLPVGMVFAGRNGSRALHYKIGPFHEARLVRRVGERWEQDCWNIPLFLWLKRAKVISEVPGEILTELVEQAERIHVSVVVDKASGFIPGIKFGMAESVALTTATLHMALSDKSALAAQVGCSSDWPGPTGCDELFTDGGPGFFGNGYQYVALCMGGHQYAAAGLPHLRGLIESIFSTLHKGFISDQVARAFENVVAKGDYEAQKRAVLTLEQFMNIMIRYVVDIYHHMTRDHGLRGSPYDEFNGRAIDSDAKQAPFKEELRAWFGISTDRMLGPHGVRFMHISYDSPYLINHRLWLESRGQENEKVEIRVDPDDLGEISVLLDGQWLTVPAKDRAFSGVPLSEWTQLLDDLRRRFKAAFEISFREHIGPALIAIARVSRAAEKAMGLEDVEWTPERLEKEEKRLKIRIVYDNDPARYSRPPTIGSGALGKTFKRKSAQPLPATPSPDAPPSQDVAPETPPPNTPPTVTRRRITFRE